MSKKKQKCLEKRFQSDVAELTMRAAVVVCISLQTVSESTPIPPHDKIQNLTGNESEKYKHDHKAY